MKRNIIYNTDCLSGLRTMPDESVNCCVTSPPYFGLRDYGHPDQIGLEETPDQYVTKMVEVFREVRRVLRNDGTCWLNLGDSYSSGGSGQNFSASHGSTANSTGEVGKYGHVKTSRNPKDIGLKPKDLIGIPWMVAFALRADGWYLRQDIIWHKPNPMPESVTDRCTKAHEYIFLLTKSARYWYDANAISEESKEWAFTGEMIKKQLAAANGAISGGTSDIAATGNTRNKRSVWTVPTQPTPEAHFATYPEDLIAPCILAGCPEGGLVLDPFMGSGTTAFVASKLGRNYVGFEINPEYIEIQKRRLNKELGMFSPDYLAGKTL